MNAKLQYQPISMNQNHVAHSARVGDDERVLSSIRRIHSDAEQICNDAADIEDARFLAQSIVETCRRFLANGNISVTSAPRADNPQADSTKADRAKLGKLSARELEIFTHLAEGRSAAEIAVTLSRSSKTINNHRTRILQKLGLKNAAELVRLALRSGLVSV
jgi:DNA-binding NarL/FixJ family response regulator